MEKKKLTLKKETIAILSGSSMGGSGSIIHTFNNCDYYCPIKDNYA